MALPGFYNQEDQDIYTGGEHFIPQERYRLNYTPSTMLASTVGNTGGVTGTQAASPYIWPPQGGGGGGGGSGNKFGLNMDTLKTISQPRYVEQGGPANMYGGQYVKDNREIAQTEGGIWKDVKTGQNVYHANLNIKTPMTMIIDKLTGKKTTDDPYAGTWYGSDWSDEDEEKGLYSRATGPKNIIQRWMENKKIEKAKKIKEAELHEQTVTDDQKGGDYRPGDNTINWNPNITGTKSFHPSQGNVNTGGYQQDKGSHHPDSNTSGAVSTGEGNNPWGRAEGGRIGYRWGESVDPEEPAENIFEIMQDQNIPFSEQVEGGPTQEQIAMVMDMDNREMGIDEIVSLTGLGKEVVLSILGVDMAQGGIARLL